MAFDFLKDINNATGNEAGNSIGRMIASGIGVGLSEESYRAITAMENVYVELETLSKNAAKNAANLEKKRQKRTLENLKQAKELEFITEQEYYEKLKEYRDKNLREGTDAWYDCTEEIAKYNKRMLEEMTETQEKVAEKYLESVKDCIQKEKTLNEMRERISDSLKDDGSLVKHEKVTFKGQNVNGTDLVYRSTSLKEFEEETSLINRYHDAVLRLKELGNIPVGIFDELSKLGTAEGLELAMMLLNSDDNSRERFIESFNRREFAAQNAAVDLNNIFNEEIIKEQGLDVAEAFINGLREKGLANEAFLDILEQSFDGVPLQYYYLGCEVGEEFGNGFMIKVNELMEETRAYVVNSMKNVMSDVIVSGAGGTTVNSGNSTSYTNTFNFNSSADTTTQQLSAARNATVLQRLRGGVQ